MGCLYKNLDTYEPAAWDLLYLVKWLDKKADATLNYPLF